MEASRFWKLRNRWHALKAHLGRSSGALPAFSGGEPGAAPASAYETWRERNMPRSSDLSRLKEASLAFTHRPVFSIITPVHDTAPGHLNAMVESVLAQVYDRWELCIADDASADPRVRRTVLDYAERDPRVKAVFRSANGGISRATNSALDLATGEFVVFLDHDDALTPDALYELCLRINHRPDVDIVYSDEDKIDEQGRLYDPHFKPAWCPESFLARMYVGHVLACRRSRVAALGGMRPEFDGSQDYDLVLRLTDETANVEHVPRVLYHWRAHPNSTAYDMRAKRFATEAAARALNAALARRGEAGLITANRDHPGTYAVRFEIRAPGRVSVIIPTRDNPADLDRCLRSVARHTSHADLEVLVLDNGSIEAASFAGFEEAVRRDPRVRVVRYDVPFNFSAINNYAAAQSSGKYLLFLNDDTEVLSDAWIEGMLEHAQRPAIGAVGTLLLYPDGRVQHAGVIVGLGGVAGHSHKYYPGDAPGYYYMLKTLNNYSAVTAACMMLRRDAFELVGGFDEELAVAFNDVDLCLRLRSAGYRNVYVPNVVLFHHESKTRGLETTPEKRERFAKEIATMKARWSGALQTDPCYSRNLTRDREDFSLAP